MADDHSDPQEHRYGELLFGRRIRLQVLLWAFSQQTTVFHQSQAARGIGYSASGEVGKELERLVELGMLRKFARPRRQGPQNYMCDLEHPGWGIARAAQLAVESDRQAEAAESSSRSAV